MRFAGPRDQIESDKCARGFVDPQNASGYPGDFVESQVPDEVRHLSGFPLSLHAANRSASTSESSGFTIQTLQATFHRKQKARINNTVIFGDVKTVVTVRPVRSQKARSMLVRRSPERSVTEVRLVEAAAQLFARHGFKATTTREIAQLAGLNEATLFRYFPRKPELFLAALESHLNRVKFSHDLQTSLANDDVPEVVLPKIVAFLLNVLNTQPELRSLLHVARFELPEAQRIIQEHVGPIFDALCGYFKRSVDREAICNIEPELAALGLLGVVSAHHLFREVFKGSQRVTEENRTDAYVNLWLYGLVPQSQFSMQSCDDVVSATL
jgi:AcrR family transcriptional regulator